MREIFYNCRTTREVDEGARGAQIKVPPEAEDDQEGEVSKAKPGDIHDVRCRAFWTELNPGAWVQGVIEDGYKITFEVTPERYKENNNASAKQYIEFVREEAKKLMEREVIKKVEMEPTCTNPLTVAARKKEDGTMKLKLCLDLSRNVNPKIKKEGSKLTTFTTAMGLDGQAITWLYMISHQHITM